MKPPDAALDAVALRHDIHRNPELSGMEVGTARCIAAELRRLGPDALIEGLGGHGVAAVFDGSPPGPTVLLRSELDALPISEARTAAVRSSVDGVAHLCGHDGHTAILAAVAADLAAIRPRRGRVVLLFQPAEETGAGAAAIVADERFQSLRPDFAFALHNIPGAPLGRILLREGVFACASRGMSIVLTGVAAHAAQPETGISPARAMCRIIDALAELPPALVPGGEIGFATVVGARLGEKAFGTAPGQATIWVTLRSETDDTMAALVAHAEAVVTAAAAADDLEVDIAYGDVFTATVNSAEAVRIVRAAAGDLHLAELEGPFRWSEDFGRLAVLGAGAMFGLGSGEQAPELHRPDYAFPDELIAPAAALWRRIIDRCLVRWRGGPGGLASSSARHG